MRKIEPFVGFVWNLTFLGSFGLYEILCLVAQ